MQEYKYYISGEFRKSSESIEIVNPANEEVFARIFETTKEEIDFAIEKARDAQKKWKTVSFRERAKVLREIAKIILDNLPLFAELETTEIGKPLKESLFVDVPLSAECFNYYASFLDSLEEECFESDLGIDLLRYEAFGVCAVYLPYNVPLMIFGFSCAAALAAGNALIIKPSEYGSLSVLRLAEFLDRLDIPKGLINIVSGRGEGIGKHLARSKVDILSFTGARKTLCKIIAQSVENPKKIVCELGGCNLAVIFSDADREESIQNVLAGSFIKQGQMCIGTSFILVQQDIYKDYVNDYINRIKKIKVSDPFLPDVGIGPLPTKAHLEEVRRRVKEMENKGARILYAGEINGVKGYFCPPILIEVDYVVYEEFFAPVVLIKSFKDYNEVKQIIEDNPTGLVLQIWTEDLKKADSLSNVAECGTVWINTFAQMTPQTPFGGRKQSGWGRNLGKIGFYEYVQTKHIGIGFRKSPVSGWFGL